jgi:hypothetical protein
MLIKAKVNVLWNARTFGVIGINQCFIQTECFLLQGEDYHAGMSSQMVNNCNTFHDVVPYVVNILGLCCENLKSWYVV